MQAIISLHEPLVLRNVLRRLMEGKISMEEAERMLKANAVEEVGAMAQLDVGRAIRKGIPEIILAEGKRTDDIVKIASRAYERNGSVLISRIRAAQAGEVRRRIPRTAEAKYFDEAAILRVWRRGFRRASNGGRVGVLTAGTSDIPIAEEARVVAEEMGCETMRAYDVGVAGIHRLFKPLREMMAKGVHAIVVVAGREGALPAVVAGAVDVPVIGVPTSVGYGYGERGQAALMAMLQACPLGLAVVNIDAGVAGGALAALIANKMAERGRR